MRFSESTFWMVFIRKEICLPSENELCQLYGMTRPTVRQSLSTLANDGYIRKHQGKGSIVHHLPREIGILSVSGTTSAVGDRNLKTKIIVKPVLMPWPDDFMFPLIGTGKGIRLYLYGKGQTS